MPSVEQDVFAREVVKLARINHEGDQVALVFLQGFIHQPDGFEERNIYVGGAMEYEQRALEAIDV